MRVALGRGVLLAIIGVCAWSGAASAERDFYLGSMYSSHASALTNSVTEPLPTKAAKPQIEKINTDLTLNKSSYVLRIPRILGVFR